MRGGKKLPQGRLALDGPPAGGAVLRPKPEPRRRYRNLIPYRGTIWYRRRVAGEDVRVNTTLTSWGEALRWRGEFEQELGLDQTSKSGRRAPTLSETADRYLKEDQAELSATTRRDKASHLRSDGLLMRPLGGDPLDAITPERLDEWWSTTIGCPTDREMPRSRSTGLNHLSTLSRVFNFALRRGIEVTNPVPVFRARYLRDRSRTKRGRASQESRIRPIEDPADLARLVRAARDEGLEAEVAVLLMLDAGLRVAEVRGLRWGAIGFGANEDDRSRGLIIDRSKPSGTQQIEETKSGRARKVALSRRLRDALRRLYRQRARQALQGLRELEPRDDRLVLPSFCQANFRGRQWGRILRRAGLGHWRPKDLRDTYASQLLTCGVPVAYISRQLGHSDLGTTTKHYARWCGDDAYREPMGLRPGEVPANLLARLPGAKAQTSSPKWTQSGHTQVTSA
jgi:integrase